MKIATTGNHVNFTYEDFNTYTRPRDLRMHDSATVKQDSITGGYYVYGALGCSKTCDTVQQALLSLLGGRRLLSFQVYC